jgi:hypothetical protein
MYVMNIQNDVIGLVLRQNCKSKQVTDYIAWPSSITLGYLITVPVCGCLYAHPIKYRKGYENSGVFSIKVFSQH